MLTSESFRKKVSFIIKSLDDQSKLHNFFYDERIVKSVISIEDKRFFIHYGHDTYSILRALVHNIKTKRIQGASTIEQQLIRIILKDRRLTIKRKITEILLSTKLYRKYSKMQIIHMYLWNYPFSDSIIGITSFCKKTGYIANKLSDKDVCEIVARIKYPIITNRNYLRYLRRVRTIEILNKYNNG